MTVSTDYGWRPDTDAAPIPPDHSSCDECGEVHPDDEMTTTGDGDVICADCRQFWGLCRYCADLFHDSDLASPSDGTATQNRWTACERCRDDRGWSQCSQCEAWCLYGTHEDYCQDCQHLCDCWDCRDDHDDCECDECYSPGGSGLIRNYSFQPEPVMHGDGQYHLGLELEIEAPYRSDVDRAARVAADGFGDLAYLKDDCSIDAGFEIVTHPMTHDYAAVAAHFWHTLDRLREMGCDGDRTGIHVHVSRSAFDTAGHVFRWMKLIYRNRRDVQRLARRRCDEWAAFSPYTRESVQRYAKATDAINKGRRPNADGLYGERYSAINVNNYATFEVRVFRASLDREEVRAALDLVAASVEYTRDLTVAEIVHGGWTWDNFMTWAAQRPEYSALVAQNGTV